MKLKTVPARWNVTTQLSSFPLGCNKIVMVEYSNNKFIIVTKTVLVFFILSGVGAAISGRIFTWPGIMASVLLYGLIQKSAWIIGGLRAFGGYLMFYTAFQIKSLLIQPIDSLIVILLIIQLLIFAYGLFSIIVTPKYIKTVVQNSVAT